MSVFPPAREGWADGNGRRLLGLDSRVLQLNVDLRDSEMPAPNGAVVGIRSAARSLKAAVRSLYQRLTRCRDEDTEAGVVDEKSVEKALGEYRQTLQNTFGSSERISDVISVVERFVNSPFVE